MPTRSSFTGLAMGSLLILTALSLAAGCSRSGAGPQHQVRDVDGMTVDVTVRTGLPQDTTSSNPGARAGDNTLIVTLRDDRSGAPIADANVAAAAATSLTGEQHPESGRAQGNGVYFTPIRFGVPDTYNVIVTVQRPGRSEPSAAQFKITAS